MRLRKSLPIAFLILSSLRVLSYPAAGAEKKYDPGTSDTEIKIGNIMPYSGPASGYSTIGKAEAAYFKMINENGGINGRRINFISYDDAYSPPKTVEQARKLVESDEVLLIFGPTGTASNAAIQRYLNGKKVPQLFVASGATRWGDYKNFPWTMGWLPTFRSEGRIYAKYILEHYPAGKIGVLFQNDDFGKDYLKGLKDGLADKQSMIVAEAPYETGYPTVDSEVLRLKSSGADVLVTFASPKYAAQTIRKLAEIGWKPAHFLTNVSASVGGTLKPAGLENSKGILSTAYLKDPTDPQWAGDPSMDEFLRFLAKYQSDADPTDLGNIYGYSAAQVLLHVLKNCGNELTRENVMHQATNLDLELGVLLPGIKVKTSPTDYYPIEQLQMMRFDGQKWQLFGPVMIGDVDG
jgi:branched-chain amino acid transport system substrate-binding protein